jgi:hypothetical protein
MPTYPQSPRIIKGAIIAISETNPQPVTIAFQYNPDTVKRSLQPQMAGGDQGERSYIVRYTGAPVETIDVEINIDAIDLLEAGDQEAGQYGIYPQLSLLELLVYPGSARVIQNDALLSMGMLEIAPLAAPLTLFVWGASRVMPVRLNSFTITEELFDPNLNPIRATIALNMRALSYSDLDPSTKGYNLFLAYQQTKEMLASQVASSAPVTVIGVDARQY